LHRLRTVNKPKNQSQKRTVAGSGAVFITLFALIWDAIVLRFVIPQPHIPLWFKAIFALAGLLVTWGALYAWRQRLAGGGIGLRLSHDPVVHGTPVLAGFDLSKPISAAQWRVEAKITSKARNQSSFGTVWSQEFAAQLLNGTHVSAEFKLPTDFPATTASGGDTSYACTLTLKADGLRWDFDLCTRQATAGEALFGAQDAKAIGNNLPTYSPEQIAKLRGRWTKFAVGFGLFVILAQIASVADLNLWSRAKARMDGGTHLSAVTTEEFDIRITNYLVNDWAFRGRLLARARVENGELKVRVQSLEVQPIGSCTAQAKACEIESVSLLLAQDGDGHFSTPAQSAAIAVNAQLKDLVRWALPAEQLGLELSLRLPAVVDAQNMRLKLQIRTAAGSTVYPDHGSYLALHRALAQAQGQKNPCERLNNKLDWVRADCAEQLQQALGKGEGLVQSVSAQAERSVRASREFAAKLGIGSVPSFVPTSPDELLIEALLNENFAVASVLLAAGADPNAENADEPGRTALGYAAAANSIDMVERLLRAGAQANARKNNSKGQVVTPLTQALRTDASAAVQRLLQAGASYQTDDPSGWTPMHIAAHESADKSLRALVGAGADVNERTPAYRQQTALQTALQFGSLETARALVQLGADVRLRDNQDKNACDWAQFFKRSAEIQSLVCP
jgi:Ankyrin repeats (3 copies)/Ankyrin repeats (many copies)